MHKIDEDKESIDELIEINLARCFILLNGDKDFNAEDIYTITGNIFENILDIDFEKIKDCIDNNKKLNVEINKEKINSFYFHKRVLFNYLISFKSLKYRIRDREARHEYMLLLKEIINQYKTVFQAINIEEAEITEEPTKPRSFSSFIRSLID